MFKKLKNHGVQSVGNGQDKWDFRKDPVWNMLNRIKGFQEGERIKSGHDLRSQDIQGLTYSYAILEFHYRQTAFKNGNWMAKKILKA